MPRAPAAQVCGNHENVAASLAAARRPLHRRRGSGPLGSESGEANAPCRGHLHPMHCGAGTAGAKCTPIRTTTLALGQGTVDGNSVLIRADREHRTAIQTATETTSQDLVGRDDQGRFQM